MVTTFVYLPRGENPYLLRCWLRTQGDGVKIGLLSDHEEAKALQEAFPAIQSLTVLNGNGSLPESVANEISVMPCPELVVPQTPDRVPMRFQHGTLLSDFSPHGALIRTAWQWGFRALRFVAHGGEERLAIPHHLDSFKNRHAGKRCFVVGNGPSLQQLDMSLLRDEITFGSNRCFLGYPQWGFPFRYWGVYDAFQIERYHDIYEKNIPEDTIKFLPLEYASVLRAANTCLVPCVWPRSTARAFSASPDHCYVGFTVTYMLLQLAAMMGCDPIILIGTDHRYELRQRGYSRWARQLRRGITRRLRGGRLYETALSAQRGWKRHRTATINPALWSTDDATQPTHFTTAYTDHGKNQFLPPEPEEAERDFDCAQAWAVAQGRTILNATPNSALTSFPTTDFDDLFS